MHLGPGIEHILRLEPELGPAQPRMAERDFRDVARIGEQAEVEGGDRREAKIVAGQRVHRRPAPPVSAEARSEPVVRPAGLRLDLMTRGAPALSCGVAVQIVDLRQARRDRYLIDEGDGVGDRELESPATAAAEEAASSASSSATSATSVT